MTPGERQVWAAAFVRSIAKYGPVAWAIGLRNAVQDASNAIYAMHEALSLLEADDHEDGQAVDMLREMLSSGNGTGPKPLYSEAEYAEVRRSWKRQDDRCTHESIKRMANATVCDDCGEVLPP